MLLEAEGLRRQRFEHTLSHNTRHVFQTDSNRGKAVFALAWAALSYWYVPHILRGTNKR